VVARTALSLKVIYYIGIQREVRRKRAPSPAIHSEQDRMAWIEMNAKPNRKATSNRRDIYEIRKSWFPSSDSYCFERPGQLRPKHSRWDSSGNGLTANNTKWRPNYRRCSGSSATIPQFWGVAFRSGHIPSTVAALYRERVGVDSMRPRWQSEQDSTYSRGGAQDTDFEQSCDRLDCLWMVSQGIFRGSSTEDAIN